MLRTYGLTTITRGIRCNFISHRHQKTSKYIFHSEFRHERLVSTSLARHSQNIGRTAYHSSKIDRKSENLSHNSSHDSFDLKYSFKETFDMTSSRCDIYEVKEGGYISLSENDIKTYLPELQFSNIKEEFEASGCNNMMVRDANKFLCKFVEQYENKSTGAGQSLEAAFSNSLTLNGLMNRPEWPTAKLNSYYYGKQFAIPTKWTQSPVVAVKGPESKQDKLINILLTESGGNIPHKILLTGNLYILLFFVSTFIF